MLNAQQHTSRKARTARWRQATAGVRRSVSLTFSLWALCLTALFRDELLGGLARREVGVAPCHVSPRGDSRGTLGVLYMYRFALLRRIARGFVQGERGIGTPACIECYCATLFSEARRIDFSKRCYLPAMPVVLGSDESVPAVLQIRRYLRNRALKPTSTKRNFRSGASMCACARHTQNVRALNGHHAYSKNEK